MRGAVGGPRIRHRLVEIKARARHLREIGLTLVAAGATLGQEIHQKDTYLAAEGGRLKIRASSAGENQLVFYRRKNISNVKRSNIWIVETSHPEALTLILRRVMAPFAQVEKTRTVYYYKGVRIHLDRIPGLGSYIEFEAAVDPDRRPTASPREKSRKTLGHLIELCRIRKGDFLPSSYADMVRHSKRRWRANTTVRWNG